MITEGEFKDIRGRVARIAGQQRVVAELFDGCLVATAYIPKRAMEMYNEHKIVSILKFRMVPLLKLPFRTDIPTQLGIRFLAKLQT